MAPETFGSRNQGMRSNWVTIVPSALPLARKLNGWKTIRDVLKIKELKFLFGRRTGKTR